MPWTKASFGSYVNNVGQTKPYSVFHHVPENAKGLVFFFHGMTGRAANGSEVTADFFKIENFPDSADGDDPCPKHTGCQCSSLRRRQSPASFRYP